MTAKLLSPSIIIAVDKDDGRLEAAKKIGADVTINATDDVKGKVMELTGGKGCDVVMEAVGIPATFEMCQDLVAFGGNIANIGVHGAPANLAIEKLWGYNISKLISTTPNILRRLTRYSDNHGLRQHNHHAVAADYV